MGGKNHATGTVCDAVDRLGGDIIKELIGCGVGELGGSIFLAKNGTEANKGLVFDRTPIVEEGSNYALDEFDTSII